MNNMWQMIYVLQINKGKQKFKSMNTFFKFTLKDQPTFHI